MWRLYNSGGQTGNGHAPGAFKKRPFGPKNSFIRRHLFAPWGNPKRVLCTNIKLYPHSCVRAWYSFGVRYWDIQISYWHTTKEESCRSRRWRLQRKKRTLLLQGLHDFAGKTDDAWTSSCEERTTTVSKLKPKLQSAFCNHWDTIW